MIPVTQFILGNSDPLLYPSEKMTNSIDEQIAFLQSQKQAINEAYRRNAIPNANNGTTQNQQVPTQGIWDAIDAEIAPLTQEQQNMLLSNQDYVNNYNALQSMVQAEVLNLVRGNYLMMLNLVMFMLQLMLNIMIMLNYLKNGLVVI